MKYPSVIRLETLILSFKSAVNVRLFDEDNKFITRFPIISLTSPQKAKNRDHVRLVLF